MNATERKLSKKEHQREEIANSLTHGAGLVFSIFGLVYLLVRAVRDGSTWHIVSFAIYGVTLLLLYLASTLYHYALILREETWLKRLDHSAIFLLIAGTYTPFLLNNLRGSWGWSLFGVIWGLALLGLVIKLGFIEKLQRTSLVMYLVMGWLSVIAVGELISRVGRTSLILLAIGGICYTVGVVFYLWRRLPYNHTIWHFFVLGGSITHYFSVINIL